MFQASPQVTRAAGAQLRSPDSPPGVCGHSFLCPCEECPYFLPAARRPAQGGRCPVALETRASAQTDCWHPPGHHPSAFPADTGAGGRGPGCTQSVSQGAGVGEMGRYPERRQPGARVCHSLSGLSWVLGRPETCGFPRGLEQPMTSPGPSRGRTPWGPSVAASRRLGSAQLRCSGRWKWPDPQVHVDVRFQTQGLSALLRCQLTWGGAVYPGHPPLPPGPA